MDSIRNKFIEKLNFVVVPYVKESTSMVPWIKKKVKKD